MGLPDFSKNPALWLGLRQAESLREALKANLNARPLGHDRMRNWISSQGIEVDPDVSDSQLVFLAFANGFESTLGVPPDVLVRATNAPKREWQDLGEERSGAGWRNPANFLITSAFVRLLGAWEQYEIDVLKALFYYRPLGLLGEEEDQTIVQAEPDVIREKPSHEQENGQVEYAKPAIWTWIRRYAENNSERASIFKRVFGINSVPDECTEKKKVWYQKRNYIVHGRAGVDMTLAEYVEVDVLVAQSMIHLSQECGKKLKLLV